MLRLGVGSGSQGCPGNCGRSPRESGHNLGLIAAPTVPRVCEGRDTDPRAQITSGGPQEMGPPGLQESFSTSAKQTNKPKNGIGIWVVLMTL